jgi:hypothetical protein
LLKEKNISEIWALLRKKEKENGLNHLSLIEKDILEYLAFIIGNNNQIPLSTILEKWAYPRATFFRSFKKNFMKKNRK